MLFSFTACDEAAELANDIAEAASEIDNIANEAESLAEKADGLFGTEDTTEAPEPTETIVEELPETITEETPTVEFSGELNAIDEDGVYTSKEDVALYIYTYGYLPGNFMTKSEARDLGWEGGSLEPYAPGMCIGGDRFGNYEGLLPEEYSYYECDIDTLGASSRGAKRLVFTYDGLIYYTDDHYESFELLYGEP
ncbi:MAG: ribonuclease [Ruminococcaceae bacterium]|nr:ribonuclease [Oscillospiraceae bacterium]